MTNVNWVDNTYVLAADLEQWRFMTRSLTLLLQQKYGWWRKPSSLDVMAHGIDLPIGVVQLEGTDQELNYKFVERMEALGGVLCTGSPTDELISHRFDKADKCLYKYLKAFPGKAPVTLKLKAYASMPTACALFLSCIAHCSAAAMQYDGNELRSARYSV